MSKNMSPPTPARVTLEEYLALPETTRPHGLVDGELRATAAPSTWHQTVLNRVARAPEDFVESRTLGLVFRTPVDVTLDPGAGLALQPDISHIRRLDQRPPLTIAVCTAPDTLTSPLLPGLALPVAPVFAR